MKTESFIVNEKKSENGLLLIVTDQEIMGKRFEEGKKQLDLTQKFYQGPEKTVEEVTALMKSAYLLHLTGKRAVLLGTELGLIDDKKVLIIKKVPHAEAVLSG